MINKIELKNFKAHAHTCLNFHPGVNVITGISQAGKTNILQALDLVRTNRPLGFKYHSNFTEEPETSVGIICDRKKIEFIKTENNAHYKIKGKKLDVIGRSVPEEVTQVLNMGDINYQDQDNPIYLVNESHGEIARTINKITHLDEVDEWVRILTTEVNSCSKEIKRIDSSLESTELQLAKYDGVDEINKLIKELEIRNKRLDKVRGKEKLLTNLIVQYNLKNKQIKNINKFLEVKIFIDKIEKCENELTYLIEVKSLLVKYLKMSKRVEELESTDITQNLIELEEKTNIYNNLIEEEGLLIDYIENKNKEVKLIEECELAVDKYIDVLKQDKQCPTCFSDINNEAVKRIIKRLR